MRSFSGLAGRDLRWQGHVPWQILPEGTIDYVLYEAGEPVVAAQAAWKRLDHFDMVMESSEGTYQAHLDVHDWKRRSVAWKSGESTSLAGFVLESEGSFTARGWITTASGKRLVWEPTHDVGYEYVVFAPGGHRLITLSAVVTFAIGGNPGQMLISPEAAADPELPALVVLSFALACEQYMLLHRSAPLPLPQSL